MKKYCISPGKIPRAFSMEKKGGIRELTARKL
jgi:hypothetical protein